MHVKHYILGIAILLLTIFAIYLPFSQSLVSHEIIYPADIHFKKGLKYLAIDSLSKAENAFKVSISYQPRFSLPYYHLAEVYESEGRFELARDEYEHAIELDPEFYQAFYKLAVLLERQREYPAAIAFLKRAVVLNPYYRTAYEKLARLYMEIGDFKSAEKIQSIVAMLEYSRSGK
jgi:tetratricopeptide (TPR) repeat protein